MEKVLEEEVGVNVVASGSSNATADSSSVNKSSMMEVMEVGEMLESMSTIHQVHYL